MIALINSYMEVEVTHTIPDVSVIRLDVLRNGWREPLLLFFKYIAYWFLTCESRLLDTGGNKYGEYLIHCSDADVTSVLRT